MIQYRVRIPPGPFLLALLLLTLLPLAELALLIWIGRRIGLLPTLVLCASTGFAGAWLMRRQGVRTLRAAQAALAQGRFPADEILDGACILVGGVLLLTPGLVTDAMGLVFLIPPARAVLKRAAKRWWRRRQGVIDV